MHDAELQLIVEACQSTFANRPSLTELPGPDIRWDRVVALSRRHRVQGLAWEGLESCRDNIPCEFADLLRNEAGDVVRANLQIAVESERLLSHFRAGNVDLLFLKGLAVGALAYRNPYLKMGWDIDLLVSPTRLDRSAQLLRSAGYEPAIPHDSNDDQLATWHVARKESVWRTANGAFYIDLHTRLADNPAMLRNVGMTSPRQVAQLGENVHLPTLGPEELFAYLAVHGASSAWFRLKWAADMAALLAAKKAMEIEYLYDRSQQLGAGRAAAQALLLVDDLFGIGLDSRFRWQLERDPLVRWLVRSALREIVKREEPTKRPLGTLAIHLTQLAMIPGVGFAISEAGRQLRDALSQASTDHQVTRRTQVAFAAARSARHDH